MRTGTRLLLTGLVGLSVVVASSVALAQAQRGQRGEGGLRGGDGPAWSQRGERARDGREAGGPGRGERLGPMGRHGHGPMAMLHCLRSLDATDEQRETIRGLMEAHRDEMESHFDAVNEAREAYQTLLAQPEPDGDALTQAEEAIRELVNIGLDARFDLAREIRAALTAEQAATLVDCIAEKPTR